MAWFAAGVIVPVAAKEEVCARPSRRTHVRLDLLGWCTWAGPATATASVDQISSVQVVGDKPLPRWHPASPALNCCGPPRDCRDSDPVCLQVAAGSVALVRAIERESGRHGVRALGGALNSGGHSYRRFSTDGRSAEQSSVSGQIGQFWTAERPSP